MSPEAERLVESFRCAAISQGIETGRRDTVVPSAHTNKHRAALAAHIEALERDAARYRWIKMSAPPNQPAELFEQMLAAKKLVESYDLFCRPWTTWDDSIDAAMRADKEGR